MQYSLLNNSVIMEVSVEDLATHLCSDFTKPYHDYLGVSFFKEVGRFGIIVMALVSSAFYINSWVDR